MCLSNLTPISSNFRFQTKKKVWANLERQDPLASSSSSTTEEVIDRGAGSSRPTCAVTPPGTAPICQESPSRRASPSPLPTLPPPRPQSAPHLLLHAHSGRVDDGGKVGRRVGHRSGGPRLDRARECLEAAMDSMLRKV